MTRRYKSLAEMGYSGCEHPRRVETACGEKFERCRITCGFCLAEWNPDLRQWDGGSIHAMPAQEIEHELPDSWLLNDA